MTKDYNVIWIDDEWEDLIEFRKECDELGIHLKPFKNQNSGMEELDLHPHYWDAIILDGEIMDKSDHEEASSEHLLTALTHLASRPISVQIPYFICTGKNKVKDNDMLKGKVIYKKGEDEEKLFNDIIQTIDNIEKFRVKLIYKDIIDFLGKINRDVCESIICIFDKMHNPDSNDYFDSKLYYNQIRQALECIFIAANEKGIIPDQCFNGNRPNIDQCYRYLVGDPAEHAKVRCCKRIAPYYIDSMMSLIKNIGNEFSHPNENNKTHYMLYSLTFNLYEIATWMFRYIEENPDKEKNSKMCVLLDSPKQEMLGTINTEKGKIYSANIGKGLIIDKKFGYLKGYSPQEYNYGINEIVTFELKDAINPRDNSPISFAINVRPSKKD